MDDAFALLRLQIEWGVDEALDPDPVDRLRLAEPPPSLPRPAPRSAPLSAPGSAPWAVAPASPADQPRAVAGRVPAGVPAGVPAERAMAAAGQAGSLDALRDAIAAFDGCVLRDTASHLVWAEGDPDSPVLVVGDVPGREEDRSGHPFAGPDGALLDQMLASIGLTRAQLYVRLKRHGLE